MGSYRALDRHEQLRAVADVHRLALLRRLMAGPATITQLGTAFSRHPAWIRHHIKTLEVAGLVELAEVRKTANYIEKFYRASADAYSVQMLLTPDFADRRSLVVLGSSDFAVELLAETVGRDRDIAVVPVAVGSLDGLIALRQGLADAAGCHLLDVDSAQYNVPYIRHIFPDRSITIMTLAHREQGLIVASGNPRGLKDIGDLSGGVRVVNRNTGSGTRIWLDRALQRAGVPAESLIGYEDTALTHAEVAERVARGAADVGLGIRAAAEKAGLDFVPLFHERYDIAVATERLGEKAIQELLEPLTSARFSRQLRTMPGYDTRHTGDAERIAG